MKPTLATLTLLLRAPLAALFAADFQVAPDGNDANPASAQGTKDERNAVIAQTMAASPLRDPRHGDFTLAKDVADYPRDFAWIDVRQIGLDGTASSGVTLAEMAREGGVLSWNAPMNVETRGAWDQRTAPGMWGLDNFNHLLARPQDDASVTFTLPICRDGRYDVRLTFPAHANRATNAHVEVVHADGRSEERVDMRSFGFGNLLGRYRFNAEQPARVVISAARANGWVAIEGIGFVRTPDSRLCPAVPETRRRDR